MKILQKSIAVISFLGLYGCAIWAQPSVQIAHNAEIRINIHTQGRRAPRITSLINCKLLLATHEASPMIEPVKPCDRISINPSCTKPADLVVWDRGGNVKPGGNKGRTRGFIKGRRYIWVTKNWRCTDGHYADLRFLTNGSNVHYPGLDLSEYTTITVIMKCKPGMTVEAFFGASGDSEQEFLQDIHGDHRSHVYTWDISGLDRTNIQNALWLHVPTWKNERLSNHNTLWMHVDLVMLSR